MERKLALVRVPAVGCGVESVAADPGRVPALRRWIERILLDSPSAPRRSVDTGPSLGPVRVVTDPRDIHLA